MPNTELATLAFMSAYFEALTRYGLDTTAQAVKDRAKTGAAAWLTEQSVLPPDYITARDAYFAGYEMGINHAELDDSVEVRWAEYYYMRLQAALAVNRILDVELDLVKQAAGKQRKEFVFTRFALLLTVAVLLVTIIKVNI
jgi:hypothetical protein